MMHAATMFVIFFGILLVRVAELIGLMRVRWRRKSTAPWKTVSRTVLKTMTMNKFASETDLQPAVLLVKSGGPSALPEWQRLFAEMVPDLRVCGWQDEGVDPAHVHYVLVWEPETGRIAQYPNLRLIASSAAGVDHILADTALPAHLPIIRMVTPETVQRMADFVVLSALMLLRQMPSIFRAQSEARWDEGLTGKMSTETTVGILGLGQLGSNAARKLAAVGFPVQGWSRSAKAIEDVHCLYGESGFETLIASSDILINLLPDTASTRHLLNAGVFSRMRPGSALINVGRANQIDQDALLNALNSGHLAGAVLDVFENEPLRVAHPFWTHPAVIVTPHIASAVSLPGKARQVASVIAADRNGQPLPNLYNSAQGY